MTSQDDRRPALVIFLGALGDLVLALPAVEALRSRGPVEAWGPDSERLALARAPRGPFSTTERMPVEASALFVDGPLPRALAERLARYRCVVALARDEGPLAARARALRGAAIPPYPDGAREGKGPRVHAADFALSGVVSAGLGDPVPAIPRLEPTTADLADARALLARAGAREPFAIVHPGAGARSKRAPAELLGRAIALATDDDVSWVRVLGPAELDPPDRSLEVPGVATTIASPPLGAMAGLARLARVWLGHDAGGSHVAAASGCRVVALFGPTDPARWTPRGNVTVIEAPERDLARLDAERVAEVIRSD
jgi:ADP-heptose:LPS heptosyltransferase